MIMRTETVKALKRNSGTGTRSRGSSLSDCNVLGKVIDGEVKQQVKKALAAVLELVEEC